MSNCINSGIRKIFILTQFNSASLNRHIARIYNFGNGVNFGDGFVEVEWCRRTLHFTCILCIFKILKRKIEEYEMNIDVEKQIYFMFQVLAAMQTPGESGQRWFQGTADAVRQFIWVFEVGFCKFLHTLDKIWAENEANFLFDDFCRMLRTRMLSIY